MHVLPSTTADIFLVLLVSTEQLASAVTTLFFLNGTKKASLRSNLYMVVEMYFSWQLGPSPCARVLKSDNLQYNTLGRWNDRLIDQASDVPNIYFFS